LGTNVSLAEIRAVSEASVWRLFGQARTILITLPDADMTLTRKDRLRLHALAHKARKTDTAHQASLCPELATYYFQQDHCAILRQSPIAVMDVETWLYGFGRWDARSVIDDTNSAAFADIADLAVRILAELDDALRCLNASPSRPIRAVTRSRALDLMNRFSTFRTDHVRRIVGRGLALSELEDMHKDFRAIRAAYEQLHAFAEPCIVDLLHQLDVEAMALSGRAEQDTFSGRTSIRFFRAFIRGILGSANPP
jgi:hypothetical protein